MGVWVGERRTAEAEAWSMEAGTTVCKEFVCTEGQARPIPRDCRSEKLEAGQRILTTETLIKAFSLIRRPRFLPVV